MSLPEGVQEMHHFDLLMFDHAQIYWVTHYIHLILMIYTTLFYHLAI